MSLKGKYFKTIILFIALVLNGNMACAQSLTGTTGLLRIPAAGIEQDRTLIAGISFLDRSFLTYSGFQYDAIAGYATLSFLPFLEVSIRYTRQIGRGPDGYDSYFADRMPSFKLRLWKEKEFRPAFAVGSTDFITSIKEGNGPHYFASYYVVMTKNMLSKNKKIGVDITLGYAFKLDNPAAYDLLGWFGGIRLFHPRYEWLSAMMDFDSKYWNVGIRLFLFKHLQLMPVLRNGNTFEGNIAYWIYL